MTLLSLNHPWSVTLLSHSLGIINWSLEHIYDFGAEEQAQGNAVAAQVDEKISNRAFLSDEEKVSLCFFIAAMKSRTKSIRDFQKTQWEQILSKMEGMDEWLKTASPEQIESAISRTS